MFRSAVVIGVLTALTVPGTAAAQARGGGPAPVAIVQHTGASHDSRERGGSCHAVVVFCVGKTIAGAAVGAAGKVVGVAGKAIGTGAGALAGGVMDGVVSWAADGAAFLVKQIARKVDSATRPQVEAPWYRREYASMARLAISLSLLFLLLAAGHSVVRQDAMIVLRAAFSALPLAFLLTFAALTSVRLGLEVTDWMTSTALTGSGADPAEAFKGIVAVFRPLGLVQPPIAPFILFLTAVVTALLALVVWLELELREQAVYVATAFLPLTFVATVWRPTAIWCRRLTEGLTALILSKFVVAVAFALAAGELGHAAINRSAGLSTIVGGCAVLLIAALAPWVVVRLVPFSSSAPEQALNRQQVGGAIRTTPGASTAAGATRLLMYGRFGAPAASRSSADTPASGPPVAPEARRADVPIASLPPGEGRKEDRNASH